MQNLSIAQLKKKKRRFRCLPDILNHLIYSTILETDATFKGISISNVLCFYTCDMFVHIVAMVTSSGDLCVFFEKIRKLVT